MRAYGVDLAYNAMETNARDEVVDYLMVGDYTEMECEYDWMFCCDMLEHLPNSQLEPTLQKIAQESAKGLYLQVPTFPDHGKQWEEDCDFVLHHTVKDAAWWADTFRAVFGEDVDMHTTARGEARDLLDAKEFSDAIGLVGGFGPDSPQAPLLVVGGGPTVWDDYRRLTARLTTYQVLAVNAVGCYVPECHYWFSLHADYLANWALTRQLIG